MSTLSALRAAHALDEPGHLGADRADAPVDVPELTRTTALLPLPS